MSFLITSDDLKQHVSTPTTQHLYITEQIETFIRETVGEGYVPYDEFFGKRILRELMEEEKVTLLTTIINVSPQRSHNSAYNQIVSSLTDGIFYFKELDILYASYMFLTHDGFRRSDYRLYAKNDDAVQAFLSFKENREKERQLQIVEVFKDTKNGVRRSEERITRSVSREHVYMDQRIKDEIFRSIDTFFGKGKSFYTEFELPYKRGILLYGSAGNGKTTLVKSIAASVNAPVLYYQINQFTTGDSIQEVFDDASRLAPVILVIEDVDSLPETARSAFLNILDGATSKDGIFLIGTTNYPERLEEGLMNRAGRFDRTYEIGKPDAVIRSQFFTHTKLNNLLENDDMDRLVELSEDLSLAQLNELYTALAMDLYEERTINIEATVKMLHEANHKQKTHSWEKNSVTVGFA